MTHLPTIRELPVLSQDTTLMVVEHYVTNMAAGTLRGEDLSTAKSFVMTALRRAQRDARINLDDHQEAETKIDIMLSIAPHVAVSSLKADDCHAWLEDKQIEHKVFWYRGSMVFVFSDFDDAILFKLWV